MNIYEIMILVAVILSILVTVNYQIVLPHLKKKAVEAKRRPAGQDGMVT
jgi:hypothetical protein